jgi:hypothetical protein
MDSTPNPQEQTSASIRELPPREAFNRNQTPIAFCRNRPKKLSEEFTRPSINFTR